METDPETNNKQDQEPQDLKQQASSLIAKIDKIANMFKTEDLFVEREDIKGVETSSPYFALEQIATAVYTISNIEMGDEALVSNRIMLEEAIDALENIPNLNEEIALIIKEVKIFIETHPSEFKYVQSDLEIAS